MVSRDIIPFDINIMAVGTTSDNISSKGKTLDEASMLSYPNFVRGLLFDVMQPLVDRFEVLGTLCCTIREVPRHAGNQKEALLCNT